MAYLCKQKPTVKEQFSCGTCAINNFVYGIDGLDRSSDEERTGELYWQLDYLQKLFTKLFSQLSAPYLPGGRTAVIVASFL